MSPPWTVAFLLCLSLPLSAAEPSFKDLTMTVSQFEREGHRIAVQIDSKEYAGIAISNRPRSGWMFSKIEKDNLFQTDLESVLFVDKDRSVVEIAKDFLLVVEDYYILQRTALKDFRGCPGIGNSPDNKEPFHLVYGTTKYYLMAMKKNLNNADSEKVVGTFQGDPKDLKPYNNFFYGLDHQATKIKHTIAEKGGSMKPDYADVFCVKKPKTIGSNRK